MNGIGTRQLETSRLILRRFETKDAMDMYQNYTSDDEVTKYLMWPTHKSIETTREFVKSVLEQYTNPFFFNWAIEDKELGQVIGSIAVVRYDEKIESVHIGYVLERAWWGKGIMTEAIRREVYEETGTEYEIDRLAFIHENYFTGTVSLSGYECHEIALYYLMKPRGSRQLNSSSYTGGVKEQMHWLPIETINDYEAYPSFYKERLKEIIESDHVVHIVTDERMKGRE